jgi:hypothetical protein
VSPSGDEETYAGAAFAILDGILCVNPFSISLELPLSFSEDMIDLTTIGKN